jgi:Holliday junction resolvase RusA-like endonuclease
LTKKITCKPVTFGEGHRDPNSSYNKFKDAIKQGVHVKETLSSKLTVTATIYLTKDRSERSDIDNYAKPIIDALHEVKVFNKESQIYKLSLVKIDVTYPKEEGIEIEVCEIK